MWGISCNRRELQRKGGERKGRKSRRERVQCPKVLQEEKQGEDGQQERAQERVRDVWWREMRDACVSEWESVGRMYV